VLLFITKKSSFWEHADEPRYFCGGFDPLVGVGFMHS
jgi:hypothetical protein